MYAYDPVGNRLGRGATSYVYDKADRLKSVNGVGYSSDANGNLTVRGTNGSFSYDQANRLKSANVAGALTAYAYDGDGKRTSKAVSGTTTSYLYDVNRPLPVLLEDGTRKYVWGLGLAYAIDSSNNVEVFHTDGLSSVRAITDGSGALVQAYQTDEFGVPALTEGTRAQPFGFIGEQRDAETGLVYLRARLYDPQLGRFVSRDPASRVFAGLQPPNGYAYVLNIPATYTDARGLTARAVTSWRAVSATRRRRKYLSRDRSVTRGMRCVCTRAAFSGTRVGGRAWENPSGIGSGSSG